MTIDSQPPQKPEQPAPREIHADGDYVARDKIVLEDEVQGDKITTNHGIAEADLAALFKTINQSIDSRVADASMDKDVLKATVGSIEREAKKGDEANSTLVEKSLKTLALMAKDIFDGTMAALVSPGGEVATAVKSAAEKAKREEGG